MALSFRLWGDPELQVLPRSAGRATGGPRAANGSARNVANRYARPRLPEARSDKYLAAVFPNSQAAGLLKTEGETMKRISPFYYFCLPLPASNEFPDAAHAGVTELTPSFGDPSRVEARVDRSRGLLYLVYFPDREKPGGSVVLRLEAVPAPSRPGGLRSDGQVEFRMDDPDPRGAWDRLSGDAAQS